MIAKSESIEKIICKIIYFLFALVTLLPLVHSLNFYFPYVTLRNFSFRFIIEIQIILFLILTLKNKSYFPHIKLPFLGILFSIIVFFFADTFGASPEKSLWGNFERMDGLAQLIHLAAFTLIAASTLKTQKQWSVLAHLSLTIAMLVGLLSFQELIIDRQSLISSTLGNSSYLAIYATFHIFIAAILLSSSTKFKFLYMLLILFLFFIIYNTGSRGSFLAVLTGIVIAILTLGNLKVYRKYFIIMFCFLSIIIPGLWYAKDSSFVKSNKTLSRVVDFNSSSSTRLKLWSIAYEGIKERPLLGWGQENFDLVVDKYYKTSLGDVEEWFDRAHSTLIEWTVAGGLLGGLSYVVIFIFTLWSLWKSDEPRVNKALISGMTVAYFVYNLFLFDNLISLIFYFLIIAYVSRNKNLNKDRSIKIPALIFLSVLTMFLTYNFFFINLPAFKASRILGSSMYFSKLYKERSYETLKKLSAEKSFGQREVKEQLVVLTYSMFSDDHEKNEFAIEVLKSYPDNFRRAYLNLFMATNKDQTEIYFSEAIHHSPGRQMAYYEMIKFYLSIADYKKALETARAVYEIDPKVNRSKVAYALSLIFDNNVVASDEILKNVPLDFYVTNNLFISAYALINRKDKIVDHLRKLVEYNPGQPDAHTSLGMMLSETGQEAEAQLEYKKAQQLTQDLLLKN